MFFNLSSVKVEEGTVLAYLGIMVIHACLASLKHFNLVLEFLILSRDFLGTCEPYYYACRLSSVGTADTPVDSDRVIRRSRWRHDRTQIALSPACSWVRTLSFVVDFHVPRPLSQPSRSCPVFPMNAVFYSSPFT